MICPSCKAPNAPDERFCWRCHVPLEPGKPYQPHWASHSSTVRTRRRAIIILGLAVAAAVGVPSVQSVLYKRGPAYVVGKFLEAREKKDFAKMYSMVSSSTRRRYKLKDFKESLSRQAAFAEEYKVRSSSVIGKKAMVQVMVMSRLKASASNPEGGAFPEEKVFLAVKEGGIWRVDIPPPERGE